MSLFSRVAFLLLVRLQVFTAWEDVLLKVIPQNHFHMMIKSVLQADLA